MSVVAVCSGKGSPGATFVAVNLAAAMARAGEEVLLLDLDPSGGDVAAYLGLDPRRGLYPLLRMDSGVPSSGALVRESEERDGMHVLAGFPDASPLTSPAVLTTLVNRAREVGHTTILDLGRVSADTAIAAHDADRVLLVVRPDLVSVLGAQRAVWQLEDRHVDRERIGGVLCGAARHRPADVAEVAEAIGVSVIASVPPGRRQARKALIAQRPISKGPLAKSFRSLASRMVSHPSPAQPMVAGVLEVAI